MQIIEFENRPSPKSCILASDWERKNTWLVKTSQEKIESNLIPSISFFLKSKNTKHPKKVKICMSERIWEKVFQKIKIYFSTSTKETKNNMLIFLAFLKVPFPFLPKKSYSFPLTNAKLENICHFGPWKCQI